MNGAGQPSFSSLQNFRDGAAAILFYAFDAPVLGGADLRSKRATPFKPRGRVSIRTYAAIRESEGNGGRLLLSGLVCLTAANPRYLLVV